MGTLSSFGNGLLAYLAGVLTLATLGAAAPVPSGLPDNAALVYYQACLFRYVSLESVSDFYWTSDPNAEVRSFVQSRDYQFLMELVTDASKLPRCDWGLVRRQSLSAPGQVIVRVRDLTYLLIVQAKVSACDGQYRAALENALTMRRIARHFGDETLIMYIQAEATNSRAFKLIQYVLGKMPPDVETLTWLETELAAGGGEMEWRPRETLPKWLDWEVQCLLASPDALARAMEHSAPRAETEGLTPAQALERARLAWEGVFESMLDILESEKSPQDKDRALDILSLEAEAKMLGGDSALAVAQKEESLADKERALLPLVLEAQARGDMMGHPMALLPDCTGALHLYNRLAMLRARVHAVQAAIRIYQIKASTGRLPQTLPEGLPKDPYSDEDFEYQMTEEGFILRCRASFDGGQLRPEPKQFDFQVTEEAN